ncbi:MAG: hypothetical protein EOS27_18590 [Mesorhizobium sp.]|nr:MAG: hypothetical protein EOS27_18590 [Mesorhizobium sp.]TIX21402.1 MAG: hypothetical protein E5V35_29590 [Mesorhizobium sp.]
MTERLEVEETDGGFRVLDQTGVELAHVFRRSEAFAFARDRRARVHLTWERTVIGGNEIPRDFSARHGDHTAGRIMPTVSGDQPGSWAWFVNGTDPDTGRGCSMGGRESSKDQAVEELEAAYTEFIASGDKYGRRSKNG